MRLIIDRFEEEFVVIELENKEMVNVPRSIFPIEAKEGDIIKIIIDEEETEIRRLRIQEKFNSLLGE